MGHELSWLFVQTVCMPLKDSFWNVREKGKYTLRFKEESFSLVVEKYENLKNMIRITRKKQRKQNFHFGRKIFISLSFSVAFHSNGLTFRL